MTQSKKEVAERNARIRAEKLRENLNRRKQQSRQQKAELPGDIAANDLENDDQPAINSVG